MTSVVAGPKKRRAALLLHYSVSERLVGLGRGHSFGRRSIKPHSTRRKRRASFALNFPSTRRKRGDVNGGHDSFEATIEAAVDKDWHLFIFVLDNLFAGHGWLSSKLDPCQERDLR